MSSSLKSYLLGLFFLAACTFVGAQQVNQITIFNETYQPLSVSWVGQDGVAQPYAVPAIQPGGSGLIQSYPGTEWQVTSNQSVVDSLTVSDVTKEWRVINKVVAITIQNNSALEYGVTLAYPGEAEAWHTEKISSGGKINIQSAVGTSGRVWDPSQNLIGTFTINQNGEAFAFPKKSTIAPPPTPSETGTPTTPIQPATQKNEPLGEPVVKYGFQTNASPIAEQVDLRGIWYRSAPPNLARYMGEGYIFSNDVIYKSNRELSIQQISGYADQMIMLRHEVDNVYFLGQLIKEGRPDGPEYTWETTPLRLLVTGKGQVYFDYHDTEKDGFHVNRSVHNVPVPAVSDEPVLATGRWSFGTSRARWRISNVDGGAITQYGDGIAKIDHTSDLQIGFAFPDPLPNDSNLMNLFLKVGKTGNLYYAGTQLDVGKQRTLMYDRGFHKDRPNFLSFTGENKALLQPYFSTTPIPLKRLSTWTIDPRGEWETAAGTGSESLFINFAEGEEDEISPSITLEYPSKAAVFTFRPYLAEKDTYKIKAAMDSVTRRALRTPSGTLKVRNGRAGEEVVLTMANEAALTLVRKGEDLAAGIASQAVVDSEWEYWIRDKQQKTWLSRPQIPATVPADQGFIGEFAGNFSAVLHGYNVLAVDPYDLEGIYRKGRVMPRSGNFPIHPNTFDYKKLGNMSGPGGVRAERRNIFQGVKLNSLNWHTCVNTSLRLPFSFRGESVKNASGTNELTAVFSESSLKETESINVSLSMAGKPGKAPPQGKNQKWKNQAGPPGSASFGYSKEKETLNSTNDVLLFRTGGSSSHWLYLCKRFASLDPIFVQTVNSLPVPPPGGGGDQDAILREYIRFFEDWGTHYPIATLFGARATYTETKSAETVMKTLSENFSANGSIPLGKLPASANVGYSKGTKSTDSSTSSIERGEWRLVGSDNGTVNVTDTSLGLGGGSAPVKVELSPIPELLTARLFGARTPEARAALSERKYVMWNCLNNYLSLARIAAQNREPEVLTVRCDYLSCFKSDDAGNKVDAFYTSKPIEMEVLKRGENGVYQKFGNSLSILNVPEKDRKEITENRCLFDHTKPPTVNLLVSRKLVMRNNVPTFVSDFSQYRFRFSGLFRDSDFAKFVDDRAFWDPLTVVLNLEDSSFDGGKILSKSVKTNPNPLYHHGIGQFELAYRVWASRPEMNQRIKDPFPSLPAFTPIPLSYKPIDE